MSDIRLDTTATSPTRVTGSGGLRLARGTRDGAIFSAPWIQALVFEGRVFGINAGTVTTPIAGHVAVDADQPEAAVRIPDGTVGIPLYLTATVETGSTTLGVGGLMFAVSNIDVGNGTSTAATPFNLRMDNLVATAATARTAYTGNGTDPLTAGNYIELDRQSFALDSDAVTSGFWIPRLTWSAQGNGLTPVVMDAGSILFYAEHANNAPSVYGTLVWAELSETDL